MGAGGGGDFLEAVSRIVNKIRRADINARSRAGVGYSFGLRKGGEVCARVGLIKRRKSLER